MGSASLTRDALLWFAGRVLNAAVRWPCFSFWGGGAPSAGHDIALALLKVEAASEGADLEVPVLGQRRAAEVIPESPYDPKNLRLRM